MAKGTPTQGNDNIINNNNNNINNDDDDDDDEESQRLANRHRRPFFFPIVAAWPLIISLSVESKVTVYVVR